jgi:hypothetical protein
VGVGAGAGSANVGVGETADFVHPDKKRKRDEQIKRRVDIMFLKKVSVRFGNFTADALSGRGF